MMGAQSERLLLQAISARPNFIGGTLRLNAGYSGPILQIYNGTTVQDVPSVNAIAAFCGASNGFVSKIYDQSGNARDFAQATTTKLPKIYDGATTALLRGTAHGPVVMSFDGVDDYLPRAADGCGIVGSPSFTYWQMNKVVFNASAGYAHFGTTGTTGGDITFHIIYNYNGLGLDVPRITSSPSNLDVIFQDTLPGGETSTQFHEDIVNSIGGISGSGHITWNLNGTSLPPTDVTVGTPNANNLASGIGARTAGSLPFKGSLACLGMWSPQLSAVDFALLKKFCQIWRSQA
jgi:hypothetical protein